MQCEKRCGQPRARDPQISKQPPKEERVRGVQQNVNPMIARRIQSPERVLDQEGRLDERKILRRGVERKPDAPQAIRSREQLVSRYIEIVVPNIARVPGLLVGEHASQSEAQAEDPITSANVRRRSARPGESFSTRV